MAPSRLKIVFILSKKPRFSKGSLCVPCLPLVSEQEFYITGFISSSFASSAQKLHTGEWPNWLALCIPLPSVAAAAAEYLSCDLSNQAGEVDLAPWGAPHFSEGMAVIWGIPEDYHVKPPPKVTMKLSTSPGPPPRKCSNFRTNKLNRR